MKQTVVRWLEQNLPSLFIDDSGHYRKLFEEANKMFEDQLINFHIETMKLGLIEEGVGKWEDVYLPIIKDIAEKNYNKIYRPE